jgi:hypothetical protein
MKVEWIATFLIALIGTFLMGLSVQTTRELSVTVETIKNRMQSQEGRLSGGQVADEFCGWRAHPESRKPRRLLRNKTCQSKNTEKSFAKTERSRPCCCKEKSRLHKLRDKFKAEKN